MTEDVASMPTDRILHPMCAGKCFSTCGLPGGRVGAERSRIPEVHVYFSSVTL